MQYFTEDFLLFLNELHRNNNREWFNNHKAEFIKYVKDPFQHLIEDLISELKATYISDLELEAKQAIFRIYRDVRFSKDKTPYQTHVSAIISPSGRKDKNDPGIYIHIGHGVAHLAGGCYSPDKNQLSKIRHALIDQEKRVKKIIGKADLKKTFGEMRGEKNKIVSAPFKEAAKNWPLLLNKQYYFMTDLDPKKMTQHSNLKKFIIDHYKILLDWNAFLREVL